MLSLTALSELGKVLLVTVLLAAMGFGYISTHVEDFASLAQMGLGVGLAHFGWMAGVAFLLLVATVGAAAPSTFRCRSSITASNCA